MKKNACDVTHNISLSLNTFTYVIYEIMELHKVHPSVFILETLNGLFLINILKYIANKLEYNVRVK